MHYLFIVPIYVCLVPPHQQEEMLPLWNSFGNRSAQTVPTRFLWSARHARSCRECRAAISLLNTFLMARANDDWLCAVAVPANLHLHQIKMESIYER